MTATDVFLEIMGSVVTPILIAIAGIYAEFNRRKANKLKKLEEEVKARKEADDKKKIDDINNAIKEVADGLKEVKDEMDILKEQNDIQDKSIRAVVSTNQINGRCTYELAQLVMTLSEGMRDQHLDGNITRAIDQYRKFESGTLGSFLTGKNPLDDKEDN